MQYRLEASWLYDFIAAGEYNFGLNIGTGFEITHLLAGSDTRDSLNIKVDSGMSAAWVGSLGLHYFYKSNHQFFITYYYCSYSTAKGGAKTSVQDSLSSPDSLDIIPLGSFVASPRHMLALSYVYKF